MYTCLACHRTGKVRKDGCCPHCWTRVRNYTAFDGTKIWVPENQDAPPTQLLKFWFDETSERMSGDQNMRIVFTIHPVRQEARYQREVSIAGKLLMEADWDIELAKTALGKVVHNKYKVPTTLAWVGDDYNAMLAIARAERDADHIKTSEDYTREAVDNMEDVWE